MLASLPKTKTRLEKWPAITMPPVLRRSKAIADFRKICQANPESESLGLISFRDGQIGSARLKHYPNIADKPLAFFVGSSEVVRKADAWQQEGRKIVIAHSHPPKQRPWFSAADIDTITRWGCAGALFYANDYKHIHYFDSTMPASSDYEGRPWCEVENNCFTLVRDYLAHEKDFDLEGAVLRAARSLNLGLNCSSIPSLRESLMQSPSMPSIYAIAQKCLVKVGDRSSWSSLVQEGDVLVFTPSHGWPVHLGIMGPLENNKFLHYPVNRRSCYETFDSECRRSLVGIYRVPD